MEGLFQLQEARAVDVKIQTRNLEINEVVKERINHKLEQINRHLPGITNAEVELTSETTRSHQDRIVAEATLEVGGTILRAERRGPNTDSAINAMVEALDHQLKRYKSRAYRSERSKQNVPLRTQEAEELARSTPDFEGQVLPDGDLVRIKQFQMDPMTVEEAAFQMQLLGHRFYMFFNSDSGQYNVIYLRDQGGYGLIQPV
jgi:putative sigma-54 modulation protein